MYNLELSHQRVLTFQLLALTSEQSLYKAAGGRTHLGIGLVLTPASGSPELSRVSLAFFMETWPLPGLGSLEQHGLQESLCVSFRKARRLRM